MSGFLLDTDIPSEMLRPRPDASVADWLVHGLTLATRNVKDFAGLGVMAFNPGIGARGFQNCPPGSGVLKFLKG